VRLSSLGDHLDTGARKRPNEFYKAQPQVLRTVLLTLEQAVATTVAIVGEVRMREPRFTRQLFVQFQAAPDATPGSPRYDITHQPELPITDDRGVVVRYRVLDLRILFQRQLGRTGDYLCLECKYLDTANRETDREYVEEGVERIVSGDYSAGHPWAVMVGLECTGDLDLSAENVNRRLKDRYGQEGGFRLQSSIRLANVRESEHPQAGGPHRITIVHGFFLIGKRRLRPRLGPLEVDIGGFGEAQ
jgi:hypothetical protein